MVGRRRSAPDPDDEHRDDERHDRPLRLFRQRRRAGQPQAPQLCEHLREMPAREVAERPPGCEDHQPGDGVVVHLRMCLTCGHVACCDSSPPRHATAHSTSTGHPVMQSVEPGENWRWCYVHELLG
jgi:CPA1 family monovalent cation:H+ antiporter